MTQQRYIYPGSTDVGSIQARYGNPAPSPGAIALQELITSRELLYDRVISTTLELPYTFDEIKIQPNELAVSTALYNSVDRLYKNFVYINQNSFISTNDLPGKYMGFFGATSGVSAEPIFIEYDSSSIDNHLPYVSAGDLSEITPSLDNLVDGIWLRDDTAVSTPLSGIGHIGFVINSKTLSVIKMTAGDGDPTALDYQPWEVLDEFKTVDDIKSNKNRLNYTNLTRMRVDSKNNLYLLDKGNNTTGGTRSMIYKYDISGFITTKDIIESGRKFLSSSLGNVNHVTNPFDIIDPICFDFDSNDNLILFDEGDYTFKKFDNRFNYIDKYTRKTSVFKGNKGTSKKYIGINDMVIDKETDDIYVLTPSGYILVFDKTFTLKDQFKIDVDNSNQASALPADNPDSFNDYYNPGRTGHHSKEIFKSINFSHNEGNVYYILTSHRIIKRFKTQEQDIGYFSFLDNSIGRANYREYPIFLSILKDARVTIQVLRDEDDLPVETIDTKRTYTYDQLYIYGDTIDLTQVDTTTVTPQTNEDLLVGNRHFLSCKEKVNLETVLLDDDYILYDITQDTAIAYKEYTSNIIYNKLLYKLVYNHLQYLHNLRSRFSGKHISSKAYIFDGTRYIDEFEYEELILRTNKDLFIGVNEHFTSEVVNRCLETLYNIQTNIIKTLQVRSINTWPLETDNISIEPYLYTSGDEYTDTDGKKYIGYYYTDQINDQEVIVAGRSRNDGLKDSNDHPVVDRYLTPIST